MTKRIYIEKRFNTASSETITLVNSILAEYDAQGYDVSMRQLYYQLVRRNSIKNDKNSYKRLSDLVNNARLAGLVDWDIFTDRERPTIQNSHWTSPAQILRDAARSFKIDKWQEQEFYIEVMIEKRALEGILIPVCKELDIAFTANKGYSSATSLYECGQRLAGTNKRIRILHLGDHDPSGIDMTRDLEERLSMFAEREVIIKRLALNFDQVEEMHLPPNATKESDTRSAEYNKHFSASWELDAVEPATLADLVRKAVQKYRDEALWQKADLSEKQMKAELQELADDY